MIEVRIPSNAILRVELVGRSAQDRPIVCVAVSMWPSGRTRVALGGYGPVPICVLDNPEPGEAIIAAEEAFRSADDQWGSSAYRMDVAGKLVKRILETKDLFLH